MPCKTTMINFNQRLWLLLRRYMKWIMATSVVCMLHWVYCIWGPTNSSWPNCNCVKPFGFTVHLHQRAKTIDDTWLMFIAIWQLLFQQGEYQESAEQRILTCQLYQETLGEGVNPMAWLDEIGEFLMDVTERIEAHGTSTNNAATVTSVDPRPDNTFPKDKDVITMEADRILHWKTNLTFGDDEL